MILTMPSTAPASPRALRRLVLVPAARTARDRPLSPAVRRFRLAERRLEGRELPRSERFAHLKHAHD